MHLPNVNNIHVYLKTFSSNKTEITNHSVNSIKQFYIWLSALDINSQNWISVSLHQTGYFTL